MVAGWGEGGPKILAEYFWEMESGITREPLHAGNWKAHGKEEGKQAVISRPHST